MKYLFFVAFLIQGTLNLIPENLSAQNFQPTLLKDINPGPEHSNAMHIDENSVAIVNNKLFFTANDDTHGLELWVTDGTNSGTQLVKEINPGITYNQISMDATFNGKLYFTTYNQVDGQAIWVSDGTSNGTEIFKYLIPSNGGSGSSKYIEYNNELYFNANDTIWATDGTISGTQMVKDITMQNPITIFNNELYFHVNNGNGDYQLWKSDGTLSGTQFVKYVRPENFIEFNNKLYFATNNYGQGWELWSSDGTETGTQLVKEINGGDYTISSESLIVFDNKLFFQANDGVHGIELWVSDGTEAGTVVLKDINYGWGDALRGYDLIEYNSKLYFAADDGIHGFELWETDGTTAGTVMLKDINQGQASSTGFGEFRFTEYNGELFFSAKDNTHGDELWKTDGTVSGTVMVKDIYSGSENGVFYYDFGLTECNGKLYFVANDSQYGYSLCETDGTTAGTVIRKPANNTAIDAIPDSFERVGIVFQDELYFRANYDNTIGGEPYKLTTQALFVGQSEMSNVTFYPNPVDSDLFITAEVPLKKIKIYNLQGSLVKTQELEIISESFRVDLADLVAGIYFVKVSNKEHEETHQIIKN